MDIHDVIRASSWINLVHYVWVSIMCNLFEFTGYFVEDASVDLLD